MTALLEATGARSERAPHRRTPMLRIFALGALRLDGPGVAPAGDWLAQRPGELLRFLVCERRRIVPADVIGEAIWPHTGSSAPNTVRHFIHALRERLEPGRSETACSSIVICRRGGYGLDPERIWIDADEFERHAEAGAALIGAGARRAAREHLVRAAELYRDDFLADEPYADWALRERDRLRSAVCDVLRAVIPLASPGDAARYLERLAELEPFDDDVHRELISAWMLMGRRSRAARHYESFRTRVRREFGAQPGFELSELAQALEARRCA
jgi:DNA-binding SARP family transcriptional activator